MDRQSNADIGQLAVIHYVGDKDLVKEGSEKTPSDRGSKTKSQPPSTLGESIAEEETMVDDASEHKSHVSFKDEAEIEDEFQKAVEGLEQVCRMEGGGRHYISSTYFIFKPKNICSTFLF